MKCTNAPSESDAHPSAKVIIYSSKARFKTGQIVATHPAIALLEETGFTATQLLLDHVAGRWGDVGTQDAEANEFAVGNGLRVFSVFRLVSDEVLASTPKAKRSSLKTLWVITEADRSSTCLLTPSCY